MLLNYLGEKMISNIRKISGNAAGGVMLLNSEGFWLKGPRTQDEWGFMYEDREDRKFGNSFPGAWQQISNAGSGQFHNANGLFTFNTVSPLSEAMKSIKGSGTSFIAGIAHLSGHEYNWKIVSLVPPDIMSAGYRRVTGRLILMDGILVVIMAAGSLFFARSKEGQKLAEDGLHQREEQYRGLVETSIDAIISVNEERRILHWNSASENIFGYLKDEIIGKQIDFLVPEKYKQRHINGFRKFFETKEANVIGKTLEMEGLHKDGTIIPVELSVSALKTGNSYIFTGIIRDITERKQANEELERHRE
ncbi:MAG: PAS domain S-box protein, partial [Candidatus Mariimomonas ferrooxydans]